MKRSLKTLKNKLWRLVSVYIRTKDAGPTGYVRCYTCDQKKHWKQMDAGHAIPGRHNAVLFDLEIIRPQCKYCNGPKSGMQYEFGRRLNRENGEGWFEQKLAESRKVVKLYPSDVETMIGKLEQLLFHVEQK